MSICDDGVAKVRVIEACTVETQREFSKLCNN